jgi:3D (Asp-Asp-Asp) domain-containing protein
MTSMKLKHYVTRKASLKRILLFVSTVLLTMFGTIVGQKTYEPITPINYVQQINDNISIKNDVRRASSMKHINGTRMKFTCTAYCNDPITYTGNKPIPFYTLAADPSILPMGTKVYIPMFKKVFVVDDVGGAIKGKRLDIYMNTYKQAMDFGIRDLEIIILDK